MVNDNELIASMYRVVGEKARWTDVLDAMKKRLNVASAVFQHLVAQGDDLIPVTNWRDTWSTQQAPHHDAWANSSLNPRFRRDTEPHDEYDIESDQRSLAFTANDREVLKHGLASCGLGAGFWLGCKTTPGQHSTMIFHRHAGDMRDMSDLDLDFLNMLMPHFRQVSRILGNLSANEARLSMAGELMENTSLALMTCDKEFGINWMNDAAEKLVAPLPQATFTKGRLSFRSATAKAAVRDLLHGHSGDCCRVEGDAPADTLHLRVLSRDDVDPQCWGRKLTLLALCSPGAAVRIDAAEVAHLFGLTMAEAILTTHLVGGMTVKDFAAHRGIAEGTARMQLKSAMAKSGVGRQADLVRHVCQSLARL